MLGRDFVGALASGDDGLCVFEYAPGWINRGFSISPVHLPLTDQKFVFPGLSNETYKGLPGAFTDSLPDDFGNAVINAWLAGQGRDVESFTPLESPLRSPLFNDMARFCSIVAEGQVPSNGS